MAIAAVAAQDVGRDVAREDVVERQDGDAAPAAAVAELVGGPLELDTETGEDVEEVGGRRRRFTNVRKPDVGIVGGGAIAF
jgi:hypothetical protein